MTKEELRAAFAKLSLEEQLELADEFWRGLHGDPDDSPLTPEQREELARREREYEANPDACVPWEKVRADLERRLR